MNTDIRYSVAVDKGIKKWGVGWEKSLAFLCQPGAMNNIANGYRYYINKYVPKKSGRLRRSARAKYKVGGEASAGGDGTGSATVYWATEGKAAKYGHYQFVGDVYGPNKAKFNSSGAHIGWMSPKGKKKVISDPVRKLGEGTPYTYTLHDGRVVTVKGYTTPGTKYDWIGEFKKDKGDFGETAVNIRAGRYLYEMFCVKSHTKPVGGKQVYNSWNQIKNRVG